MPDFAFALAFLLLPLPLLALRLLPPARTSGGAMRAPDTVRAMAEGTEARGLVRAADRVLPWIAWVALVAALAGPRVPLTAEAAPPSGRDVIMAIDLSGSMERDDFTLDGRPAARIDVVRRIAADFVRGRRGDRVGLVVFGETAYFAAEPSHDVEAVAQAVEGMTIGVAGRSTAISDGLGLSLKRLERSDAPTRVVILLSDGTNTSGDVSATEAAALAAALGVRVHTIALGPLARSEGNDDRNAVDDVTLREIADASGGVPFRVRTPEDFLAVNEALDALEANPGDAPVTAVWRDLWTWPASVAFLAALGALVGRGTGA